MACVVATLKAKEDKLEEARALLKRVAEEVRVNEPGTLVYAVHQHREDPLTFVVYEKYESEEAFALHGKNLAAKGAEFKAVLSGRPEIVFLDEI